jgi:SAM-dependent methyltransferase
MTHEVDRSIVFGERPRSHAVERIAPGFFSPAFEREHLARYEWAARIANGKTALDVACGTGYGAKLLKRRVETILSVDLSEPALRFGSREYGIRAICANAHELPFTSTSLDAVVSLETVEHLARPERFVAEVHRVLRSGGLFLLSTPNRHLSFGRNPYHIREFILDELESILNEKGFLIHDISGQHWRLPLVFQRVRGLRRIAWEAQKMNRVIRLPILGAAPTVWCIAAAKSQANT